MDQTVAEGPKYIDKSNIKDGVFTKAKNSNRDSIQNSKTSCTTDNC
jgi:hypothetical protein